MKYIEGGICAPKGFQAAGVHCGIRPNKNKNDLALIVSDVPCAAAGLFTRNNVKAAPVLLNMETIRSGRGRAICVNSGIANACAPDDMKNAKLMQEAAAEILGISAEEVLVGSTGVIGTPLPIDAVRRGLPILKENLERSAEASDAAARAIMTTDTKKKELAVSFEIRGKRVKLGGISKGSGMIHPNMGTMLCYLTCDIAIDQPLLYKALKEACNMSFNRISVDGDTSTNDSLIILANGLAGNAMITEENEAYDTFRTVLKELCVELARQMAADGEGAKHLITCEVSGAKSEEEAEVLAKSVISSSLTKAAVFGGDANWGRVLCALGYSGVTFDTEKTDIWFASEAGEVKVCENGKGLLFDEALAGRILKEDEVIIRCAMQEGEGSAVCWGCDLTYDYVKINGDYRT
ncbi:MAG: bifunctional ornithine acetyltransferase/N-acetylglutamate synthase [Solobacterium sp.]|nr:bifunctional ornithine acetyltransferase/N-acetylglutamate synthase [Solobacterium sp.]